MKGMPPQASVSQASSGSNPAFASWVSKLRETSRIEGPGLRAVGDPGDLALEPPRIGRLAVPEGCGLHPRGVKILHLISRDHAAGEAADAGKIPRARDVARLRGGAGRREKGRGRA